MAGGFAVNTRRKILPLTGAVTRPVGGGTFGPLTLPKTGLLARIYLALRGTVAGTLTVPNGLGFSSIISRMRIQANSGIDIFNVSGAGYHYLLRNSLESEYVDPVGQSTGTTAVTATTFNLDAVIPIALNMRDPTGLIMLQNEQTIVNLFIDWLADASVASGATVTLTTGDAFLEVFTVPPDPKDWPPLNVIHQCLEDQQQIAAAGDFPYYWPRGNTYVGVYHGAGIGAAGSDLFNRFAVRVNQSDYLQSTPADFLDMEYRLQKGRVRPAGGIFVDLLATSGLGCYGLARDMFNSALVTDLASVITATGAATLFTVRRQLVVLT
ncbi:MAG TPA: hypothetical protein VH593_20365 [Ktedonobacteraceae bacterium]